MRDGDVRIVENTWLCSFCQTKNLGRDMKCAKCQAVRRKEDADIVPSPESAETVTDPELLRRANQGAHWACEYCGGQVRDEFGKCANCAGPRAEVKATPPPPRPSPKAPVEKGTPPLDLALMIAAGAAVATLFAFALVWLMKPNETHAKVAATTWQCTVRLEQRTLQHGSGWGTPWGSFNDVCHRKYYGDEDCHPHKCNPRLESYSCNCTSYDCNCRESCTSRGNGFSACTTRCSTCSRCSTCTRTVYSTCYDRCPVYKNWCTYDYYTWPVVDTKVASGNSPETFAWPALAAGENQRIHKNAGYEVKFAWGEKETWSYRPSALEDFSRFRTGSTWHLEVPIIGSNKIVKELK